MFSRSAPSFRRTRAWVLRSPIGLASSTLVAGVAGLIVVLYELVLAGAFDLIGSHTPRIIAITVIYAFIAAAIGFTIVMRMQRKRLRWWRDGTAPSPAAAHAVVRLPADIAGIVVAMWAPALVLEAILFSPYYSAHDLVIGVCLVALGGVSAAGVNYLLVDRLLRPVIPQVAQTIKLVTHLSATVAVRLMVAWSVASGVPLLGVLLVLINTASTPANQIRGAAYIAITGLILGYAASALLARMVAWPLEDLRRAVDAIQAGDLDIAIPVHATSEIGRLEASVNDMAESLRERARVREVFGRHVGDHVAQRALERGVDLTGEVKVVTALFVDIVGSTTLAHQIPPEEFVGKLNRLLSVVVAATTDNDGLVNKFEGDAALCVFGAPIGLDDDAGAALRTARRIRDEVLDIGEFDIGIGVARGLAFAGDVGAASRLEFTVIGDPVNEAARLTEAAKNVPQRILASQAVTSAADAVEREHWVVHGLLKLRGRLESTRTWTDRTRRAQVQPPSTPRSRVKSPVGSSHRKRRHT